MPKTGNVVTDDKMVLASLKSCKQTGMEPPLRSPMRLANQQIEALALLGCQVNFSWVPAHSGNIHNRWALERARGALMPKFINPKSKVYARKFHLVQRPIRKDKSGMEQP